MNEWKKTLIRFSVAVLILVITLNASAQVIAIRVGHLVDPDAGTATANQIILVEKGRITAVGPAVPIPVGATVIDLSKSYVLPGLFDAHTHLCQMTTPDDRNLFTTDIRQQTAYRALIGAAMAKEVLEAGFTTVRDVGNNGNYADTTLRNAIDNGLVPGPTMINAGRIIAPFGGQYHLRPDRVELGAPEYLFADTRDEMLKAIRENIHFGALLIKIVVDDQKYIYSADDIRFIVAEAHKAGVKVAAHCMTEPGARNAAEGGVDSIEHGYQMSDEALALAKKNNVVLVGTDFPEKTAIYLGVSPEFAKVFHGIFLDRLKRAYKIGVTMVFGTDTFFQVPGQTRGMLALDYLDTYREAGVPDKYVLQMMTSNAARLLGVDKERGFIRVGQAADLIAVPEDPQSNILTLRKVSFVMKNGKKQ
ncbi:MAG: amidohydrolase family protein [Pyrinomonadaceae bacterium]